MFLRATLCVGLIVMLVSASVGHAQDRVYNGEGGMLFHPILLEKTANFERS